MSPNLFLATQKLFSPHKWFRENKSQERSLRKTEHWAEPTPGLYEYIPGRGWYLIAKEKEAVQETTTEGGPVQAAQEPETSYEKLALPVSVHWSRVLKRYMLEPTYKDRKKHGVITTEKGKNVEVGFFRLDDGVAWVQCWDQHGTFIPGPYKLWCISARTGLFRPMLKGDDPKFAGSRGNSRSNSRNPSIERQNSAESRSTQFYPPSSHASSNRDGPSVVSTRPNSIRLTSPSTEMSLSQPVSRRSSVKRNGSVEYENDKKAMRQMARDHREALMAAANIERADTKMGVEQIERGRTEATKEVGA